MQRAERMIRVAAPVHEVYGFWRNFENLPRFMDNVKEVRPGGNGQQIWHWTLKGPVGAGIEYTTRLTEDQPNRSIGWNSTEGAIGSSGVVTFNQLDNNTEVHVVMQWFDMPGGKLGEQLAKVVRDPEKMLDEDLRRFKDVIENRVHDPAGGQSASRGR
jgi:uncharacterized membrane protein